MITKRYIGLSEQDLDLLVEEGVRKALQDHLVLPEGTD